MPWIKKNLVFVICSGVALLLLAVAGWMIMSAKGQETAIQEELSGALSTWQGLNSGGNFPSDENIQIAKSEREKFQKLWQEVSTVVPMQPSPATNVPDQVFSGLLGSTVTELRNAATASGVLLPTQFDFTFSAQRKSLNFPAGSIQAWVPQLNDIKSICLALYQARVSALDSIQRVPFSEQETGPEFLVGSTVVSNEFATLTPYSVTFRGFGPELAAALDQLQRSTNFMVIKSMTVVPSMNGLAAIDGANSSSTAPVYSRETVVRRDTVPTPQPQVQPQRVRTAPGAAANATAETVISEQPLQVTLLLDVVKLNPANPANPAQ